jgi:hypothetical protein
VQEVAKATGKTPAQVLVNVWISLRSIRTEAVEITASGVCLSMLKSACPVCRIEVVELKEFSLQALGHHLCSVILGMPRVGQDHIYTVHVQNFRQRITKIYGHIQSGYMLFWPILSV